MLTKSNRTEIQTYKVQERTLGHHVNLKKTGLTSPRLVLKVESDTHNISVVFGHGPLFSFTNYEHSGK